MRDTKKVLKDKIVYLKKIYKFATDHFYRSYIYCLLMENFIKNKNFSFPKKIYEIRKKCWEQNCSSLENIQIYYGLFFDPTTSFCFNYNK